jgi:CRP-like cAMP-binding protein
MSTADHRVATPSRHLTHLDPARSPALAIRFFGGMLQEEVDKVLAAASLKQVAAKRMIVTAGEQSSRLFVLRTGRGRYFRLTKAGDEVLLHLLGPGDIFGIGTMLRNPCSYVGSAETTSDSEVFVWEHAVIRKFAALYPKLSDNALRIALHYLKRYVDRHVGLATKPAEQRLAETLLSLGHRTGRIMSAGVQVDVTNSQLGALADISLFTTSRLLSGWERKGAVSKLRGKVLIHSPESLIVD